MSPWDSLLDSAAVGLASLQRQVSEFFFFTYVSHGRRNLFSPGSGVLDFQLCITKDNALLYTVLASSNTAAP